MYTVRYDQNTLLADIKKMGIRAGDTVVIHASMKSIGSVQGGPQAVVRAFQQAVGPRGNILMPVFSYCFEKIYEPVTPYDPVATPSQTGLLTEKFRQMAGVVRSGHPTHSVAAWGAAARELVEGHEKISGLGKNSPFHRATQPACAPIKKSRSIADRPGAKICMVGCGFTSLSLLHVAEEVAELPFLNTFNWWHQGWKPTALLKQDGRTTQVKYPVIPGCSKNFGAAEELARKHGLIREGKLGNAKVILADAAAVLALVVKRLGKEKDFLLCPTATCRACDERRAYFDLAASPGARLVGEFIIDVVNRAGIRLAGSAGEDKAAQIIAGRMEDIGLSNVDIKRFPITAWRPGYAKLSVYMNGKWENVPAAPASHGPATPANGTMGQAIILENAADIAKVSKSGADIAVLWGGFGASGAEFKKMMSSSIKAFIFVDSRFEHNDLVSVGLPAQWIRHFKKPMLSIPFPDAVRLFGRGPLQCRLTISGHNDNALSSVVTGEIPGNGKGVILVGGHHDSTFNTPAPDDNLTGVAMALAMAAKLKRSRGPRRHTIRFCSFGTEEILSEGARWYALESGLAHDVRFVVNNDSGGARVGVTRVLVTGPTALTRLVSRRIAKTHLQIQASEAINPFSDHFPFNVLGVPSLWFYRETTAGARHFHHTVRDNLVEISFQRIAELAAFEAELIAELARKEKFPFPPDFPPKIKAELGKMRCAWLEG